MGALILLLIVTTRRIRKEALVKAAVTTDVPKPIPKPQLPPLPEPPKENPVKPTVPTLPAIAEASDETDRIVAGHIAATKKLQEQRGAEYARLKAEHAAAKRKLDKLKTAIVAAQSELKTAKSRLRRIQARAAEITGEMDSDKQAVAKFKQQAADLEGRIAALRRNIVDLKQQQAQTSSKFAIVPFDGTRGTTRRPIYIECTKDELRILPEDIAIKAADLQHFGADYNPLLAGTQALIHFWNARSNLEAGGKEPAPYVLLLVRPEGTMAYYAARKMLRNLEGPSGYELIEQDWQLDMPRPHPKAKAVCRVAVDRALAARNETLKSIASGRGGIGTGDSSGRNMRFNRATGRFEVIKPNDNFIGNQKAFRGGFGKIVKTPDSDGSGVRKPSSTGTRFNRGPRIRPSVTNLKPGAGAGQAGRRGSTAKLPAGGKSGSPFPGDSTAKRSTGNQNTNGPPISPRQRTDHPLWPLTAKRDTPRPNPSGQPGNDSGDDPGEQYRGSRGADSKTGNKTSQRTGRYVGSDTPGGGAGPNNLHGLSKTKVGGGDGRGTASGKQLTQRIRWGLSDPDATIGFEKDVRIWCTADRVMIGSRQVIRVDKGLDRDDLFRKVLFAVEAEARSWGKPPKGFFWVPAPEFVISPGGNQHYERINSGLKRLGLQTSAQYRLDATPPATTNRGRGG